MKAASQLPACHFVRRPPARPPRRRRGSLSEARGTELGTAGAEEPEPRQRPQDARALGEYSRGGQVEVVGPSVETIRVWRADSRDHSPGHPSWARTKAAKPDGRDCHERNR